MVPIISVPGHCLPYKYISEMAQHNKLTASKAYSILPQCGDVCQE